MKLKTKNEKLNEQRRNRVLEEKAKAKGGGAVAGAGQGGGVGMEDSVHPSRRSRVLGA